MLNESVNKNFSKKKNLKRKRDAEVILPANTLEKWLSVKKPEPHSPKKRKVELTVDKKDPSDFGRGTRRRKGEHRHI